MNLYERRHTILDLLKKKPELSVHELAKVLRVSPGTVRNDLNALEGDGRLKRIHGGAVLFEQAEFLSVSFSARFQEHAVEKARIAEHAAHLVSDGDSLLLDASSSAYHLAQTIKDCRRLRVVTNGIDVARLLAQNPSNTVILIGGVLDSTGTSVTGLFSEQVLGELRIQKAFVSCSGFSLERGMTEVHLDEAQLKRKAVEAAAQLIALIDSSKFGQEDFTPFARPEQITRLFTDSGISPEWSARLEKASLSVTVC